VKFKRMSEVDLRGKRVFIRADLNVPIEDGQHHRRHAHPRLGAGIKRRSSRARR
jgi:3-phosphoglycerate kinase